MTFDMGGTSTDVCLVRGGLPEPAPGREVGGFPIRLPSLDVHTIGAGGGSIARVDAGGALARRAPVRRRRARARRATDAVAPSRRSPTPTSCSAAFPPTSPFPGIGVLDRGAAEAACAAAGVDPSGIVAVVDAAMEAAIRRVTVERGVDPRGLALVAFGGAGPLHACALADALGMAAVLVPARAGVLSAAGVLAAPVERELVTSWARPAEHDGLDEALEKLAAAAVAAVDVAGGGTATVTTGLDCRYAGQSHELTVPSIDAFGAEHLRRNGHERPGDVVEVVALRARASIPSPVSVLDLPAVAPRWRVGSARAGRSGLHDLGAGGVAGRERRRRSAGPAKERDVTEPSALDPAVLAVVLARLAAVAEEMLAVLRRSAFSPNIKERADCSTALFTPTGELLAQSESIPVHLGSMPASVAAAIATVGDPGAGEQIVLNDPYAGGTHLNDVTVVAPVHLGGSLVGWVANRAHHADIGGAAPGSIPADATHIAEEGIRLPPVLLTPEVRAVFLAASRTPHERAGDLDAQVGANRLGVERFAELAAQETPFEEVLGYGERRMRAALGELPRRHVAVHGSGRLDRRRTRPTRAGDGRRRRHDRRRRGVLRLHRHGAAVTRQRERGGGGDGVRRRLRPPLGDRPDDPGQRRRHATGAGGGAPRHLGRGHLSRRRRRRQRRGEPAHRRRLPRRPRPGRTGSSRRRVAGHDEQPADRRRRLGVLRDRRRRPRRPPAPSRSRVPDRRFPAVSHSRTPAPACRRSTPGMTNTSQVDAPSVGPMPGMSAVHTGMTNTKNTPTEALERAYPLRVLRYRIREGSGGAGSGSRRRRDRARPPGARGLHGVAHHRAARVAAVGSGRWRAGSGGGELAVAGRRRGAGRAAAGQVHGASCTPATWCGC